MNPVRFIQAKRDGLAHTQEEMAAFLLGYLKDEVSDYQVAAWLMAVFFRGFLRRRLSGSRRSWPIRGRSWTSPTSPTPWTSTPPGVGDKTTLVVAPILAASGCTVAKMSGRGLAHTGGTIDKLESIPGWRGR